MKPIFLLLFLFLLSFSPCDAGPNPRPEVFAEGTEMSRAVRTSVQTGYAAGSDDCANGLHKDTVISRKEPTDTQEGAVTYRCALCGREYIDNLPVTGHRWSAWVVDRDATCTREGSRHRTCTLHGGHDERETIPAAAHRYVLTEKEPACTEAGVKTYTCSICGDSYTEPGEAAAGHTYTESVTKEPSCTEDGVKTFTCAHDGHSYTEAIPAAGHAFGEWQTVEAREEIPGLRFRECTHCRLREEESIPALASPVMETPPGRVPPAQDIPGETTPEEASLFNQNDIIINAVNLMIILFFSVLLYPFVSKVRWYNRKYREFLEKQLRIHWEAKKFDNR